MTPKETRDVLSNLYIRLNLGRCNSKVEYHKTVNEAFVFALKYLEDIEKIREITERALRSSDPINLYKSCCINEIAEVIGVKVEAPAEESDKDKNQITIDDII